MNKPLSLKEVKEWLECYKGHLTAEPIISSWIEDKIAIEETIKRYFHKCWISRKVPKLEELLKELDNG